MANTTNENHDQENLKKSFIKLCQELNIDITLRDEAWQGFQTINRNVTLEGDSLHWLVCSLYVVCRKAALIKEQLSLESHMIPLAKILKNAKLSLLHFFQKVRKWLEMGQHHTLLNKQIEQLERNFSVSSIVFEKFCGIFKDIFVEDWTEHMIKRGRSNKRQPLKTKDLFAFSWILYIRTKAKFPDISDDLVNSYHLLLCCLDLVYSNTLYLKQLKPAVNMEFQGVPEGFSKIDYTTKDVPSIIDGLCHSYEGLAIETKIIRRQYLRSFVEELLKQNYLKGNPDKMLDIVDSANFEANMKYLSDSYEKHILQKGDIDERIFIRDDGSTQIGTPTKRVTAFTGVDEKERSQVKRNLQENFNKVKGFVPQTPLTGKRWLAEKEISVNPSESSITSSASRLQELLKGCKPSPSENLKTLFVSCNENPEETLRDSLNGFSVVFLKEYSQNGEITLSEDSNTVDSNKDFAKARLQLALVLFYKTLENFLEAEKKKSSADLSGLIQQEIFIKSLFSCCLEIVIYSYNSSRVFPWVINVFNLKPYHFFKVIELVIRGEDLSRNVIKHLSRIEEQILESLSWQTNSPIYDAIKTYGIPKCQEVASDSGVMTPLFFMSPTTVRVNKDGLQSPILTLKDKFSAPPASPARRNLFGSPSKMDVSSAATSPLKQQSTAVVLPPKSTASSLSSVRFPIMLTSPGSSPVRFLAVTPQRGTPQRTAGVIRIQASPNKVNNKKYGSLGIFFRKLYHMSSLRLKDLCDKLEINGELHKKIWTCFEYGLVENTDMLRDRHIDQLLMCAVYVMSKVTKEDKSFHDIMKYYRTQPQAISDVYRHVLVQRGLDLVTNSEVDSSTTSGEKPNEEKESGVVNGKKNVTGNWSNIKKESIDDVMIGDDPTKNVYNDLIQFYNIVYIKKIKDFALKFASNKVTLDAPPLSPLPVSRKQVHSPRKLSKQHQIYISPIKPALAHMTPRSKMLYCFDSDSPKKLSEINAMIKGGTRRRVILDLDDESAPSPPKRPMNGLARRAQELRQEQMNYRGMSKHQ